MLGRSNVLNASGTSASASRRSVLGNWWPRGGIVAPAHSTVEPKVPCNVRALQQAVHAGVDGIWGAETDRNCELIRHFCAFGSKPNGDCKKPGENAFAVLSRQASQRALLARLDAW